MSCEKDEYFIVIRFHRGTTKPYVPAGNLRQTQDVRDSENSIFISTLIVQLHCAEEEARPI